jgi:hypothetical protein
MECISATIDRLIAVELQEALQEVAAAAAGQPSAEQQQQAIECARQCVLSYVGETPVPSRHYTGQQVLDAENIVVLAQQKFEAAAPQALAAFLAGLRAGPA